MLESNLISKLRSTGYAVVPLPNYIVRRYPDREACDKKVYSCITSELQEPIGDAKRWQSIVRDLNQTDSLAVKEYIEEVLRKCNCNIHSVTQIKYVRTLPSARLPPFHVRTPEHEVKQTMKNVHPIQQLTVIIPLSKDGFSVRAGKYVWMSIKKAQLSGMKRNIVVVSSP